MALAGAGGQPPGRPGLPGGWIVAVTRSRHPLQPHPPLGPLAAAVVALPPPAGAPLAALPQPAAGHGRTPALPGGAAGRPLPAGPTLRRPHAPAAAGLRAVVVAAAAGPAAGDALRGGSQRLAAPDPGRRPDAEVAASPAAVPAPAAMTTWIPDPSPALPLTMSPSLDALAELIAVVARLRDPEGGCPWDLEQTHQSLLPYVLEEAHEVADAIRHGDDAHLVEELGDLLLQVLLHAQIAGETGRFDLEQIARGLSAKLIRRHPHVFGDAEASDSAAVRASWEAIKTREQLQRQGSTGGDAAPPDGTDPTGAPAAGGPSPSPLSERLATKVRGQPALAGAMTISRKAAAAGFEWDDLAGVWDKVQEELAELQDAVATAQASGERSHAQEELGDLLFTLVNVARWCGIDPEEGLAGTNRRFLDRFSRVEAALGGDLQGRSIRELESLWQQAKAAIRAEARAAGSSDGQAEEDPPSRSEACGDPAQPSAPLGSAGP